MHYVVDTYFKDRLPLQRCLSLGCGSGPIERPLAQRGVFVDCDAYDIASGSIQLAKQLATAAGYHHIHYAVADINAITLPSHTYDAVWVEGAMHHFENLEHICQQVKQSLKPGGLFIVDEYIGAKRFQFPERQKQIINHCLGLLPDQYRLLVQELEVLEAERSPLKKGLKWALSRLKDKIRDGDLLTTLQRRLRLYRAMSQNQTRLKTVVNFPTARDVIAADPSEAVRSDEIVSVIAQYFEIVEKRDWGGNILQFLLDGIAGNFDEDDPNAQAYLEMLIQIEDTYLRTGEFASDYALIVARP